MFDVSEFFCSEENYILNNSADLGTSKDKLLKDLAIQYEMNQGDDDYAYLLENLSKKIKNLSDDEYEQLISCIPLEVAWDEEEYSDENMD